MTPEERALLMQTIERLDKLERSDHYRFEKRVVLADGVGLDFSGNVGSKLGSSTSKLSFYGATPVVKSTGGIGRQDISADGGIAANRGTTYTGNTGSTAYSVGDLVYVLKTLGLIT